MSDPLNRDPQNREPLSDDLFRNRIAAALRELDQPESDADIAASLDAVDAEPLSDEASQRILRRVRHSMATTTAVVAGGSNGASDASHRISLRRVEIVPPPTRGKSQVGIVAACVVALFAIGLVFFRSNPGDRAPVAAGNRLTPELRPGELISSNDRTPWAPAHSGGSHPDSGTDRAEPSSSVAVMQRVKPGETLTTGLREKRRVTLPDGSVLSINEQSQVTIVGERRVKLLAGEVFVEVVPANNSERFVVETPHRTVTALGTKFVVKAHDRATNVVVTQGKVRVSGVEEAVSAGQELIADLTESNSAELRPAKRSAYVVEWVKDLMAAAGSIVVPTSEHAGGTVTVVDPQGQEMKLSLRKFHVDVHIEEGFARTTIDQTYFNHTWQQLEGTFRFPLPADASLSRLAMYVNGKLMEGGMVERDYGRNVFEQIRHTRRDPALLEWVDGSTFQMRVFPLEARQEKRILLSYTQRLPNDYGKSVYRFPAGHSLEGVREWSAHLRVKGEAGAKWYSPSHLLNARDEQGDLVIDGREEYAALDRDLVVEFGQEIKEKPPVELEKVIRRPMEKVRGRPPFGSQQSMWSVCEQDGFQYVMLRYRPELAAARQRSPQQWIFLVENSADRNDLLSETQRQIVKVLLENAEHTDTFSIIRAGTQAELFRRKPVECSLENVAAAQQFLRGVAPIGALDLEQALQAVQKQVRSQRDMWIVHLGTGIPVLGERDETTLLRLLPTKARYVGVSVGKRWSKSFMETAANHSGGHVTQINPDEAVAWRAFDLLSTLNAPRLTEIAVRSADNESGPEFLLLSKSQAHGQELAAVARFPKGQALPKSILITGQLDGQKNQSILEVPSPSYCGHLPRTWARLEIDRLIALGATEHKPQIIELSKAMYVMSPFTSLLVLETEAMYEQFKVDRGRKDHWAMYPAPAEITVVADQGSAQLSPLDAAKERLKLSQARAKSAQSNYERSVTEKRPATDLKRLARLNRAEQAEVRLIEREIQRIERAAEAAADPVRLAWESVVLRRSNWQQGYFQTVSTHWNWRRNRNLWMDSGLGAPEDDFGIRVLGENQGLSPIRLGFTPNFGRVAPSTTWEANAHGNLSGLDPFSVTLSVTPRIIFQEEEELLGLAFYGNSNGSDSRLDGELWGEPRDGFIPVTSYFATLGGDLDEARYGRVRLLHSTNDYILGANVSGRESKFLSDFTDWEFLESDMEGRLRGVSHRRRFSRPELLAFSVDGRLSERRQQLFENQNFDDSAFIVDGLSDDGLRLDSGSLMRRKFGEVRSGSGGRALRGDTSSRYALSQLNAFDIDMDRDGVVESLYTDLDLPGLLPRIVSGTTRFDPRVEYVIDSNGNGMIDLVEDRMADGWSYPVIGGGSMPAGRFWGQDGRLYQRRATHPLIGVMKDLPSYAPGLQTWPADRLAIVAQATAMKPMSGEVDAEARRLIEKARSLGWEKVRLISRNALASGSALAKPDASALRLVLADGSGRFVVDREVSEGLQEQVIHDGSTLWHLYPEIALGAKRTMSRFHQSAIQSLVPWYVPTVDDLSVEADVKSVGERTIRITRMKREEPEPPLGLPQGLGGLRATPKVDAASSSAKAVEPLGQAQGREGQSDAPHQIAVELVFAEDGRLSALRVIDITANKVLAKQTFSADGTVRLLDADDKLIGEVPYERQPVEAPNLVPVVKDLVVLPLPYRSTAGVPVSVPVNLQTNAPDFAKLSDDDALKLLATYFAEARQSELATFIEQRYTARGDHRIGLAVLLSSVMPQNPLVANATKQHPDLPLARFLEQFGGFPSQGSLEGTLGAGESASPFLKRVCSAYNHYSRWATDRAAARERPAADIQNELAATLLFIRECRSVDLAAKLLSTVHLALKRTERMSATFARQLIDATAALADEGGIPAFGRTVRIEWLLTVGDDASVTQARELLRTHLTDAITNGVLPELNGETRSAFVKHFKTPDGQPCGPWCELVKEAAQKLAEKKRPHTLIVLSRTCFSLSEPALAAEVFQLAIKDQDLTAHPRLNLAALVYAKEAGNWEQAEVCVRRALANEKLQQVPQLWRDAANIAHHQKKFHDWIDSLDRAYELEFAALPKTVNLETFRQDYDSLFGQLDHRTEQLVDAKQSEKLSFARLVQRAASRWRDIDTDDTAACHRTARILTKLGLATAAWNYWTTPLAETPDRSTVWLTFAAAMNSEQQFTVADRAWSTAFACESTNPEILLQHAQFLRTAGQEHRARELLTKITNNTWQPRFETIKSQAQTLLTGGIPLK